MSHARLERAFALFHARRFADALELLRRVTEAEPTSWNAWYLAGQCHRFLGDAPSAIQDLSRAAHLNSSEPTVFLALGIAFQLGEQWEGARSAFGRAIELDPDFALAFNSLAMTQKKTGELEKALHNYDAGAKALARRIVKRFENKRENLVLKHRDTQGALWVGHAMYAALLVSAAAGISAIAWPTGAQAVEEERTEKHAGLYWVDAPGKNAETVRLFLPNFFNAFREALRQDPTYCTLTGNRGTVLEILDRRDEARQHFAEASEFQP